jgi:hypothetical protein
MIDFKCRASQAKKLITNPKDAKQKLSVTTKSYLQEVAKSAIYGLQKDIYSKQIAKGITKEDEAIDCVIDWLDLPFAIKNDRRFEDEYFSGEPDLLLDDEVIDIKNSWDCWTFPLFEDELPTDDYYYQVQDDIRF